MKKAVTLLLAGILCAGLAGCGGGSTVVNTDGWVNESGEEPITLTWFVDIPTFTKRFGDTLTDREIFRKTGVRIEFSNSDEVTGNSKLANMIMSNQVTDLVSTPAEGDMHVQLIRAKQIWDMQSIFDTYTSIPNFLPEDMYNWCSFEDGKLYGLRTHFFGNECKEGDLLTNMVLVASGNLMEKYHLDPEEDFSTMDKMIASLEKVKNGEEAEGKAGFIPFYTYTGGTELSEFLAIPRETPDGDYQDWQETEEAKELAVDLNTMYRKGLISELSLTGALKMQEAMLSERTFLILMNFAESQYYMWDAYIDLGDQYVPVGPVRNDKGDRPMLTCWVPNGYLATCVSKRCKYPERALKLLQFLYSHEGQELAAFGILNDSYTIGEDGKYYYTNKYYSMDDDEIAEYYGNAWYETLVSDTPYWRGLMGIPKQDPARFTEEIFEYFSQYTYNTRALNAIHPTDTASGLPTAFAAGTAKFNWTQIITAGKIGTSDADARNAVLTTYENQLNARNNTKDYDKVKEYFNKRFHENKEKLGIDHVWTLYND